MIDSSLDRILRVAILGALALLPAACGVKGDLDPPAAAAAEAKAGQTVNTPSAQSEPKVFTEQSVVRRAPRYSVFPKMPPEEWEKNREVQSTRKPKSRRKSEPDEPFFLDPIL